MARDAGRLDAVLAVLEKEQIEDFRDQDWCTFFSYPRGSFSNILDPDSTCSLSTGPPRPFDDTATSDFDRVRQAVRESGVSAYIVSIRYDDSGRVTFARFDFNAGLYDRFYYLYDPENAVSKEPDGETIVSKRINDHWWFVSEDWN